MKIVEEINLLFIKENVRKLIKEIVSLSKQKNLSKEARISLITSIRELIKEDPSNIQFLKSSASRLRINLAEL